MAQTRGKFIPKGGMTVGDNENRDWNYIDKTGKVRIRVKADHAGPFSEGLAAFGRVKTDGYLYCGYIDRTGKEVIAPVFGSCDEFSEGLALILLDGKWHFIDKRGGFVLNPPFAQVWSFENGLSRVSRDLDPSRSADFGYIDMTGKVIWKQEE